MAFDHPVVPYGDFRIHIISHPYGKSARFKRQLEHHLIPVTREGFGNVRDPTRKEIAERTTHPSISLLIYVDEVTGKARKKETTRPVGYFSTKNLNGNTVHLLASVIAQEDQRLAWYPLCKRIAMALGPAQLRLEGGQPAFFTAQSAYPYIHRDLFADGMMPAQLHAENATLADHLSDVADALGPHDGFEKNTSIRRGAFDFDSHAGKSEKEVEKLVSEEMKKIGDPELAEQYAKLFDAMDPRDALMAIRRYRGVPDRSLGKELAELVKDRGVHEQVLAELLAGGHRRDIQRVDVAFDQKNPYTGLYVPKPIVTIRFKPQRWNLDTFSKNMLESRRQLLRKRGIGGGAGSYWIKPDEVQAPLDAAGLKFIQLALGATRTAQRQNESGKKR